MTCHGCGIQLVSSDPRAKWCSERCRKRTLYSGECRVCGAITNGYDGPGTASSLCRTCAPVENRVWTESRIIDAIRAWHAMFGEPPSAYMWDCAPDAQPSPSNDRARPWGELHPERGEYVTRARVDGTIPYATSVMDRFGSWNAAILAAGFQPVSPGNHRAQRKSMA